MLSNCALTATENEAVHLTRLPVIWEKSRATAIRKNLPTVSFGKDDGGKSEFGKGPYFYYVSMFLGIFELIHPHYLVKNFSFM